jgi:transcriptional regulator with XRE-family HTH domain
MSFASRLSQAIARLPGSQADVAKKLGLSPKRLNNYVLGKRQPSLDDLANICVNLEISPNWLLGYRDVPTELPADERELLQSFRILTPQQQSTVTELLRAMINNDPAARRKAIRPVS